jgi:hypothetical protein
VGFAKESSGGTPVAATNYVEAFSEGFTDTRDRFETRNIVGRYTEADDEAGVRRIQGNIVFAAHPVDVGYFLLAALGVNSSSTVLSGALWTNVFSPRQSDFDTVYPLQPFTFEIFRDVGSSQQYAGACCSKLEMSVVPNQDVRCTADFIGTTALNIAKTTPTYPGSPLRVFTFDTASLAIAGVANPLFESFTFSIDNQFEGVPTLNNSTFIRTMRRTGPPMVRVSGNLAFENITEYQKFVESPQVEQRFVCSVTRQDSFKMVIDVPRVVYSEFPLGMGGKERQVVSFTGMGRYHVGSGTAASVALTTTRSFF